MPPSEKPEREETDLHIMRLILRDLVYLQMMHATDNDVRQAMNHHMIALNDMIGEDDLEESKRS